MVLLIDNYDSFTFNLAQQIRGLGFRVDVVKNNKLEGVDLALYSHMVVSPGPGLPSEAGECPVFLKHGLGKLPVLGICLGHQMIAEHFGSTVGPARRVVHGKVETISHGGHFLFAGLPKMVRGTRYHSLAIRDLNQNELQRIATSEDQEIMAIAHKNLPVYGLQFHPESFGTRAGTDIMKNFLRGNA